MMPHMVDTIRGCAMPVERYRQRRRRVAQILRAVHGPLPVLVVGVGEQDPATAVQPQLGRRRQDPWFDWLCGCHEPDAVLLLDPTEGRLRSTLFLQPSDPARVIWDGERLSPGPAAKRAFGVERVAHGEGLRDAVSAAAERAGGRLGMCKRRIEPGFQSLAYQRWNRRLRGVRLVNVEPDLVGLRMIKDADEIEWHRRAVVATARGFKAALQALPGLQSEAQVAGILAQHYLQDAYEPVAFAPIVGSGPRAATLHYPHNDQALVPRAGVLIDSGAAAGGYAADVTRTIPQHGRFDQPRFRELYELVLAAQRCGIQAARPGITLEEWNAIAWQPILDAGMQRHHGLGHHLGLDVHDPADRQRPLAPGMLITCEPGVYLPEEGIGIRIEDDLLITTEGCEVTTRAIPKRIADIERLMAAGRG